MTDPLSDELSKARDYVELDTLSGEASSVASPLTGGTERVIQGDVALEGRSPQFFKRK